MWALNGSGQAIAVDSLREASVCAAIEVSIAGFPFRWQAMTHQSTNLITR